jgi:hypothetical protein
MTSAQFEMLGALAYVRSANELRCDDERKEGVGGYY